MTVLHDVIEEHALIVGQLINFTDVLNSLTLKQVAAIRAGGKIIWLGNGGSAADAQHFAAELVGRFKLERPPIASLALTTDSSILTSIANDYDFSVVFSRQIEALCKPEDVVMALSTSGNSANVVKAVEAAKKIGAYTVGLLGNDGGKLKPLVDLSLVIPSQETARIQEAHGLVGHILCEYLEAALYKEK